MHQSFSQAVNRREPHPPRRLARMGLAVIAALALPVTASAQELYAIKARHVETGAGEVLEHAVILVDDGKIVTIGEDLPIEAGIRVIELDENQWVTPGIVLGYSRIGLSSRGFTDARPQLMASAEIYPKDAAWKELREIGVVAIGVPPAGAGIPGQSVVVRPQGSTAAEMILADPGYLKVVMRSSSANKRYLKDGFAKVDQWLDKEKKNREKYDAAKEKAEKEKDADKKKEQLEKLGEYKPVDKDPGVQAFLDMRDKKLRMLATIDQAGTFLHFLDALGKEKVEWDLRMPLSLESDYFHIADRLKDVRVVMEPTMTLHPNTMRQRNLPAEMVRAGAKLVFVPRTDSLEAAETLLQDVGVLVAAGLDRATAMGAVSLEPAKMLGISETHGSLEAGKVADFLIFDGDPLEPRTKLEAVVMDGAFIHGEVNQ